MAKKEKPKFELTEPIKWQAYEFEYFEKSQAWFFISGIVAIGLLTWALWSKNFLFAILIFVGYFTVVAYAIKKPRLIDFSIEQKGIKIDNTLHHYEKLRSFCIFENPELKIKELSLRSKRKTMPYIKIPLAQQNPEEIKAVLANFIPQKKHKESIIDGISRLIKF